jgi:uncharacterized membrane protein YbhN (UPF0104 family)
VAVAIASGAILAIAEATDAAKVGHAFESFHPEWIALAVVGQLLAIPAYMLAYRSVATVGGAPAPPPGFIIRVVLAGFGPFTIGGGFDLDRRAARAGGGDGDRRVLVVLAIALLEWAVLAPVTCVAAVVLLAEGAPIEPSLLWPWAIAVPLGFGLALWASTAGRRWVSRLPIARATWTRQLLDGLQLLRILITHPRRYAGAWIGTAGYWAADIAGFYAAVRAFGLDPGVVATVLAYATGFVGTRRSLPLGGAGVTEVLLVFALYWVNEPLAPALAAVVVYRGLDLALSLAPGLIAYRSLYRRLQPQP